MRSLSQNERSHRFINGHLDQTIITGSKIRQERKQRTRDDHFSMDQHFARE
jgi:hypothetical protein